MKSKYLSYPYIIWMIIFTIIPILIILYYSLSSFGQSGLTLQYFSKAFEPTYLTVIFKSLKLAFYCTVICLIIGYPVSYILSTKEFLNKGFLLFLFIMPMWMNFLLRTYSWLNILGSNGVINNILNFFHLPKQMFLNTEGAILLGLVYNFLPFMILPIYTSLHKIDPKLIEAGQDLGANSKNIFTKIIFPLSIPGVISGITMVFMPAITTFVVSNVLGGGTHMLIGNLIEQQFLRTNNFNFGSALAIILMIIIVFISILLSLFDKNYEEKK